MNPQALSFSAPHYNGFKNNDYESGALTLSGTIVGSGNTSSVVVIPLSRDDSVTQIYFDTNRTSLGSVYLSGRTFSLPPSIDYIDGTTPLAPPGTSAYTVQFFTNFQPTQVTITAYIGNPYSVQLSNIDATYNIQVFTFIAPFVV